VRFKDAVPCLSTAFRDPVEVATLPARCRSSAAIIVMTRSAVEGYVGCRQSSSFRDPACSSESTTRAVLPVCFVSLCRAREWDFPDSKALVPKSHLPSMLELNRPDAFRSIGSSRCPELWRASAAPAAACWSSRTLRSRSLNLNCALHPATW
jgi:hypothetical protein